MKGDKKKGLDGEIEAYKDIEIVWKRGKKAIMSIFDDEMKLIKDVKLYELKTRDEMHKLLVDKGFLKKSNSEILAEMQVARRESQLRAMDQPSTVYNLLTASYFAILAVIACEL